VDSGHRPSSGRDTAAMDELIRVSHGLVKPRDAVGTLADRCAAFLEVLPAGAVVGGATAAALSGLWLPPWVEDQAPEIWLTRPVAKPRDYAHSRRPEFRCRRRSVRADDIAIVEGLPVVSVARTWVSLAESLRVEDLIAAGDSAVRALGGSEELERALSRAAGLRGVVRARQALPLLDGRARSRPESHLRSVLVLAGLPKPEVNVAISDVHGQWLAEPDLVYRRARLALEYNGALHADVDRMRRDISRQLDVEAGGWRTLTFGPGEIFGFPWRIPPIVRTLLDRRDPSWRTAA
jgi:hypothetical protein